MPPDTTASISLRRANAHDLAFLWELHRLTMRDYVDQTWGWNEQWQEQEFTRRFEPSRLQIILHEAAAIGYLSVEDGEDHVFLAAIEVTPAHQNRGIGAALISQIIQNAGRRPVKLRVLRVNPARRLYERLGFEVVEQTKTHFIMVRRPTNAA